MLRGHEKEITRVQISNDNNTVASASEDGTIRFWDLFSHTQSEFINEPKENPTCYYISKNADILVSGTGWSVNPEHGSYVQIRSLTNNWSTIKLEGHKKSNIMSIHLSENNNTLASGNTNNTVRIWDVATGLHTDFHGHESIVECVYVNKEGNIVISGSSDHTIRVWDICRNQSTVLRGHEHGVTCVCLSSDSLVASSASEDCTVRLWSLNTYKPLIVLRGYQNAIKYLQINDLGNIIAFACKPGKHIYIHNNDTGTTSQIEVSDDDVINCLCLSKDGKIIILGCNDEKSVKIWDVQSHNLLYIIHTTMFVLTASLHKNVDIISIIFQDHSIQLWHRIDDVGRSWAFKWSSLNFNNTLHLVGSEFKGSRNLDPVNYQLIEQRTKIRSSYSLIEEIDVNHILFFKRSSDLKKIKKLVSSGARISDTAARWLPKKEEESYIVQSVCGVCSLSKNDAHLAKEYFLKNMHISNGIAHCEYGLFLFNNDEYLNAIEVLNYVISLGDCISSMGFNRLTVSSLDGFLRQEINPATINGFHFLIIKSTFFAYYLLAQCYYKVKDSRNCEKIMKEFSVMVESQPDLFYYRLLAYAHQHLGNTEEAESYLGLARSLQYAYTVNEDSSVDSTDSASAAEIPWNIGLTE